MFGNSDNFTRRNKTYLGQSEARVTILGFKSLRRDTTLSRDPSRNTLFVKFKMWKVYQVQRGARHFSNEIKHHQVQVSYKWNRKKIVFYTRKDKDFSENKHPDYECRMERSMVFGYIQFSIHKQFLIYKLIFYIINIQMSLKKQQSTWFWEKQVLLFKWGYNYTYNPLPWWKPHDTHHVLLWINISQQTLYELAPLSNRASMENTGN